MPSFVWNFYTNNDTKALCQRCKTSISLGYASSTAGLRSNLVKKHQISEANFGKHCNYPIFILKIYCLVSFRDISNYMQPKKTMSEQIVELIADDGLTLNQIVHSKFLKAAFENLNWQMPSSPTTLKNILVIECQKKIENYDYEI